MPCNCGKKAQSGEWLFIAPSGKASQFPTEAQAKAAMIRAGGGQVRPK